MNQRYDLTSLSPEALVAGLERHLALDNQATADLLAHLAEVDARKLYLDHACSSMFTYCVSLHMSEATSYKRIEAARAARRFPAIFEHVASGALHLCAVTLLSPKLTPENHGELLAAAGHLSKRDVERMLAERFPRPDVPPKLRKAPRPNRGDEATTAPQAAVAPTDGSPTVEPAPALAVAAAPSSPATRPPPPAATPAFTLSLPVPARPEVKPLSRDRYYLKLTVSSSTRDKLLEAQALLRHRQPDGDLDVVLEHALDALLRDLRRDKFGETSSPRRTAKPPRAGNRHIPSSVKREVAARDGYQCTFVDERGQRCEAKAWLEYDHADLFCRGGANEASTLRLRCRPHNLHAAEKELGRDFVKRKIEAAREAASGGEGQRQRGLDPGRATSRPRPPVAGPGQAAASPKGMSPLDGSRWRAQESHSSQGTG